MRNFHSLIVSVVKTCKQCLQTASAPGRLGHQTPYRGFAPGPQWRLRLADPLGYSHQMKILLTSPLVILHTAWFICIDLYQILQLDMLAMPSSWCSFAYQINAVAPFF